MCGIRPVQSCLTRITGGGVSAGYLGTSSAQEDSVVRIGVATA
jgi:hypothetical protein